MDGLILDVPAPTGPAKPMTDLLVTLPATDWIAAALLVLLFVVAFDFVHPPGKARR